MSLPASFRTTQTIHVDWFDLDAYLKERYDCQGTHLPMECDNDTDHSFSTLPRVKPPALAQETWDSLQKHDAEDQAKALEDYKNDRLNIWDAQNLMAQATLDGHLPEAEYLVTVSW